MKLKKKVKVTITVLIVLILLGGGAYYYYNYMNKKDTKVTVEHEIKDYGYKLKNSKSTAYKKMFYKLEKILKEDPVNEESYVKQIAKMFLLDFYSLSDKAAKTDVGGIDFVNTTASTDFLEKAQDTVYKYLESDIYKQRKQTLPTVSDVKITNVEKTSYKYKDTTDDSAYVVKANITYEKDLDYPTKAVLTFVHEDKKLSLVKVE